MKTILITGASRGLGYSLSEKYLDSGFCVFSCMRNARTAAYGGLVKKYGESLHILEMDVADTGSVKEAAGKIKETTDHLDIIINNAATFSDDSGKFIDGTDVDKCLEVYNVNALGALRVVKEHLSLLKAGGIRVVANISSDAGSIGGCTRKDGFDYSMSKAALNMGSVILQNHLGEYGVKVLAIHPGWVKTDMGGPNAQIDPYEAAGNIYSVIRESAGRLDGPVYLDYKGKPLGF